MTREEQITYKAGGIADGCIAHGAPWEDYYQGFIDGAKWADANPPQPALPSNLDEAAQKVEDYYDVGEEHGYLCCHRGDIKDAFKAGAEWMEGQGVSIPGKVGICGVDVESITKELREVGFKIGDEVTLQVRKKQ